jgi:hypothetical protein
MLEITQFFTMEDPFRFSRLHSFWWRLHTLNVGDYIVFHYGKSLRARRSIPVREVRNDNHIFPEKVTNSEKGTNVENPENGFHD